MANDENKIRLTDLVSLSFWQELQDLFAKTMNIECVTIDEDGPITEVSNYSNFCGNYIRKTELGKKRCNFSNITAEYLSTNTDEPILYTCHSGLKHLVIPIIFEGKHIASVIGGQFFTEKPDETLFKNLAEELGIPPEEKESYFAALNNVRITSEETIKYASKLLYAVINAIFETAHKNHELMQNNIREKFFEEIVDVIRSSLDLDVVKHKIVYKTGELLKADRVAFADYDHLKGDYVTLPGNEYRSSPDIKTFVGYNFVKTPGFVDSIRELHISGGDIIFSDLDKYLEENGLKGSPIEDFYRKMDMLSTIAININHMDTFYGNLVIGFKKKRNISDEDVKIIRILAAQSGVAIYQAGLYSIAQEKIKEEALIRNVTEAIRSSLDFSKTKQNIVDIIGKTLNADRCFLLEYNKQYDKFLTVNEEYLSSDDIPTHLGLDLEKLIPNILERLKKRQFFFANENKLSFDDEVLDANLPIFQPDRQARIDYKVHAAVAFPIFHNEEFLGDLVIHYHDIEHEVTEEDITLLKLLADQIAMAFYQARLHEELRIQLEREKVTRSIIEILRSTLDRTVIKHLFVRNIGKYFRADRVFFVEYDNSIKKYLGIDSQAEYLSSESETSSVGYDFSQVFIEEYIKPLTEKNEIIIPNWEEYIYTHQQSDEIKELYKEANVKSSYSFPVVYEFELMGYFCVQYTNKVVELFPEDLLRIRSICTQAGIALHHAKLYMEAQDNLHEKRRIISKVKTGIKEPVENIIEKSKILSEVNLEHDKQIEYLNNIINSCNKLLELTDEISENVNKNVY